MTKKTIFTRAILSLAITASLALTAVNAAQTDNILDESIHDYSDDAKNSFNTSSSRRSWGGYDVKIVLDEAYHDYERYDVAAFETLGGNMERAEFAALEQHSSNLPWELSVVD